jgi:hypothetical protein
VLSWTLLIWGMPCAKLVEPNRVLILMVGTVQSSHTGGGRLGKAAINRIQAIRDSEVRATVFSTSKIHALNTLKMGVL